MVDVFVDGHGIRVLFSFFLFLFDDLESEGLVRNDAGFRLVDGSRVAGIFRVGDLLASVCGLLLDHCYS